MVARAGPIDAQRSRRTKAPMHRIFETDERPPSREPLVSGGLRREPAGLPAPITTTHKTDPTMPEDPPHPPPIIAQLIPPIIRRIATGDQKTRSRPAVVSGSGCLPPPPLVTSSNNASLHHG